MALTTGRTVALTILHTLTLSSCQGESITLRLQQDPHSVCFDRSVWLTCQYPNVSSGMFAAPKPSWKEDGDVFSIDHGMYRSVASINKTVLGLELVPKRSHFINESSGARNYTCFLPLVGGGVLESNLVQIRPIKELPAPVLHLVEVTEASVRLEWSYSSLRVCFEDCNITFNLTWTPSDRGQSGSIETNDTMHCITSLKRDEAYEATLTALCKGQSQVAMVSRTVVITFNTLPDPVQTESPSPMASPTPHNNSEIETASPSQLESPWPEIIGGSIGFAFLFVAMVILITLLSMCTVIVRQRKPKSESSPKHDEKDDSDVPVHVYDTVSSVTQGVRFQANPSYTPVMQSLQMPTGTVPMQANPSYITIDDLTGL